MALRILCFKKTCSYIVCTLLICEYLKKRLNVFWIIKSNPLLQFIKSTQNGTKRSSHVLTKRTVETKITRRTLNLFILPEIDALLV